MRLSVRSKLFLNFALVQLAAAALILGWYFYTVNDDLRSLARAEAEGSVLQAIEATRDYFGPAEATARLTQSLFAGRVLDRAEPEQLERYLVETLRQSPSLAGLFVGYPDGSFYYVSRDDAHGAGGTRTKEILVDAGVRTVGLRWRAQDFSVVHQEADPADDFDPRTRPWYQAAAERRELIWTAPYVFFTARKPGITTAMAVPGAGDNVAAVVGFDIELGAISRFLVQLGFRSGGSAYILSPEGEVIAHADESLVFVEGQQQGEALRFRKAAELPGVDGAVGGRLVEASAGAAEGGQLTVLEQEFEGEDYFVASEQLSEANWPWRVVAIVRGAGLLRTVDASNLLLVGVVILLTGLTCFAGFLIASGVGKPLKELHRDAKIARQGNFELMGDMASGYREIDEPHAALRALAEEKRGLVPRQGGGKPR
jgi:hypothetical protein